MKRILPLLVFALACSLGCKKEEPVVPESAAPEGTKAAGASHTPGPNGSPNGAGSAGAGGSGNSVNVTPIGGVGAGPMTPVTGTENIQGGGSGVGQVMKERAKSVAGQSPSSVNQMGDD